MKRIGDLRHRVTIQQVTETRTASGAVQDAWADVATVWAAVEPLSGREFWAAQQVNAEVTTRVRMRYRPGVMPTMRVMRGTHTYDILAVLNLRERGDEMHLLCKEVI